MKDIIQIGKLEISVADYAVGASAVLGIRDSGKTVTSKGIAEQLLDNGIPIIVFDAVGKWRWMKTAAEGHRGKAYEIVVAGGREPDLPLTTHSVPEIVRSALKERIPLIIDLFSKDLSKSDWRKIVQTAIHIIHYENEGGAVHVFLEEAAEFVPQRVYDNETYAEVEKLVRMGGNASVGITIINQRSQEVNKAVLDNCSTALVLGCQVGKNAIEAVEKWIERLDPKTADELTESLPKLKPGEAWVWTRKSLDRPTREQMPMCRSFHPDRRTPEIVLKSLKPVDTKKFVSRLADNIPKVIEAAKANDPAELRKQIAELRRQVSAPAKAPKALPPKVATVPMLTDHERTRITAVIRSFDLLTDKHGDVVKALESTGIGLIGLKPEIAWLRSKLSPQPPTPVKWPPTPAAFSPSRVAVPVPRRTAPPSYQLGDVEFKPTGTQQRILDAIAWLESIGNHKPTNTQIGAVALIDPSGGYFSNMVGPLATAGLVDRTNGVTRLTEDGRALAVVPAQAASLDAYHDVLRQRVRKMKTSGGKTIEMLDFIISQGGNEVTTAQVGEAVAIDHTGGYFSNMIGPLSAVGLIERNSGTVTPTEILFPKGLA